MRSPSLSALLLLLLAAPAGALLTDDEATNNSIADALNQIPMIVAPDTIAVDAGELELAPGDTDYVGLEGLVEGDVVMVSTTPLVDVDFEVPDTIVALFDDASETMQCLNDDAFNNDMDLFPMGYGSLCRFEIPPLGDGDYTVGVTGWSEVPFDGLHTEAGAYALSVTVVALPEPGLLLQLGTGLAGLGLLDRRRRRKIAA